MPTALLPVAPSVPVATRKMLSWSLPLLAPCHSISRSGARPVVLNVTWSTSHCTQSRVTGVETVLMVVPHNGQVADMRPGHARSRIEQFARRVGRYAIHGDYRFALPCTLNPDVRWDDDSSSRAVST